MQDKGHNSRKETTNRSQGSVIRDKDKLKILEIIESASDCDYDFEELRTFLVEETKIRSNGVRIEHIKPREVIEAAYTKHQIIVLLLGALKQNAWFFAALLAVRHFGEISDLTLAVLAALYVSSLGLWSWLVYKLRRE